MQPKPKPQQNHLLAALSPEVQDRLFPYLELVPLPSQWQAVACSADGLRVVAGGYFTSLCTLPYSGPWRLVHRSSQQWTALASSADGTNLEAVPGRGNAIGTDATRTVAKANTARGVWITNSASNVVVGGAVPGAGNLIAYNTQAGIEPDATVGTGNAFLGNALYSNGGLGNDLSGNGVTGNDGGDADTGPNGLQNYPVLSGAATNGASSVHVAGSLSTVPGVAVYRVEFFANAVADPSGNGEGQRYLGFLTAMRRIVL